MTSGRFQLCEPADKETLRAELQRIVPVELLYCEEFNEMAAIEHCRDYAVARFGNLNLALPLRY